MMTECASYGGRHVLPVKCMIHLLLFYAHGHPCPIVQGARPFLFGLDFTNELRFSDSFVMRFRRRFL